MPVAVLTTDDLDASDIDPDTCYFVAAIPLRLTMEDLDDDVDLDMLPHLRIRDLDRFEESTEATIECETTNEDLVTGTDTVRIVPSNP